MLLFLSFQSSKDLEMDRCYKSVFQRAHKNKDRITDKMIQITKNI
jgi:hypothetical protein